MAESDLPAVMKAWQYNTTKGGLEKNLKLNPSTPMPKPKPDQYLVKVLAAAINPADYKPAEVRLLDRLAIPKPATPGMDFAGSIAIPAKDSPFKPGQLVFGAAGTSLLAGGSLAEYAIVPATQILPLPKGLTPIEAAAVPVVGLTAYQTIVPHVKEGDKILINGGSGGTGTFGIQVAKTVGCYVVTTCSTANVELCKSLGADEVIDYKKQNVIEALKASGHKFDHIVDNVNSDSNLYWRCHEFTKPEALYIVVAGHITPSALFESFKKKFWPGFLGGGKRKTTGFLTSPKTEDMDVLGKWLEAGKIKPIIDQKFPFDQVPQAFEKLKTGRSRGKLVIDIASEAETQS